MNKDISLKVHNLPAVVMMECELPDELVDSLNEYLDEYMEQEDRKTLSHTLVGQIHQGEQLLMDHKDPRLVEYYEFITAMGVTYLDANANATGTKHTGRSIDIDELWSVHSYEGDYNPIHDH